MKVTNLSLKKQIKLVEKTQTLCNEIISLKYTQPEKRDKLLKNFLSQPNPLKRDLKLLQKNSLIEQRKETSKLKRRFISLEKLSSQLNINLNDKNGNRLDIYKLRIRINQKKSYLIKKDPSSDIKNIGKDYLPLINQTQVIKLLSLSDNVITFLRDTNILKWKKVQGKIYFSHNSLNQFQHTFNVNDYLTISECKRILESHNYYDYFENRISIPKFDFSITVAQLIKIGKKEIKLETVKFGATVFVTKKSMNKCIDYLKILEKEQNKGSSELVLLPKKKKKKGGIKLNPFINKFKKSLIV